MRRFQLSDMAEPLAGSLLGADAEISAVTTDSRSLQPGDLFVALRGERFDGHDFIDAVAAAGAAAVLVSRDVAAALPALKVEDTELALGRIGALNRAAFDGPVIGITGSSGKTSVKNMLAAILSGLAPTLATEGNLNNEIGVPLTLLRLEPRHRYAVVEMGAGKPGDIAYLQTLAQQDIGILLNVMPAHLERMGSLQAIAETKGAILTGCRHAIYPADSQFTEYWRELAADAHRLEFAFDESAPVHVTDLELHAEASSFRLHVESDSIAVLLPVPGRHNVANAMAAAAAAVCAGASLEDVAVGLADLSTTGGRLHRQAGRDGVVVIDDSYNANPGSVRAAIDVLANQAGRRILVLGTMAELGPDVDELHAGVGGYAAEAGLDMLWGAGDHTDAAVDAFGAGGRYFDSRESLLQALPALQPGDVVLIKGSRSAGMETVVSALLPPAANESAGDAGGDR